MLIRAYNLMLCPTPAYRLAAKAEARAMPYDQRRRRDIRHRMFRTMIQSFERDGTKFAVLQTRFADGMCGLLIRASNHLSAFPPLSTGRPAPPRCPHRPCAMPFRRRGAHVARALIRDMGGSGGVSVSPLVPFLFPPVRAIRP